MGRVLALLGCLALAACAPAVPTFGGARSTPRDRVDLALGGAVRVPLGEALPGAPASPGGIAPVAGVRLGVGPRTDVGVIVAGPLGRADLRHTLVLNPEDTVHCTLNGSVAAYAGAVDGGGLRWGADLPLTFGVDAGSLIELWVGPRLGIERAESDAEGGATGLRLGGLVGLGVGFRHLHALAEITAQWERWSGATTRSGVVLTPAFALRLRL